jgi:hypothetical protein
MVVVVVALGSFQGGKRLPGHVHVLKEENGNGTYFFLRCRLYTVLRANQIQIT